MKLRGVLPYLFLIVVAATAIYVRYGHVVRAFGTPQVVEAWYDGYKSYLVMGYHARYDSTYTFYQGMNYPYREHVIPAATEPLVANTLKLLHDAGIDWTDDVFTVLHAVMLLGLLLGALLLFALFRKFKLPVWYAALVATGVALLSPQTERMIAHFGLAQVWVVPALLLVFWHWERPGGASEKLPWRPTFALLAVVGVAAQIHFYYFAILAGPTLAYLALRWLRVRTGRALLHHALHFAVAIGVPLLLFTLWINWGDAVDDRTGRPWGFFFYRSEWEGVFLARRLPLYAELNRVYDLRHVQDEGNAYIGLVAVGFVLVAGVRWLLGFWKRRPLDPLRFAGAQERHFAYGALGAGVLLLLFSFALPFRWLGETARTLDLLGPLAQFRSIGRFAWVFYYVINVLAFVALWRGVRVWRPGARYALVGVAILVLGYEGNEFYKLHPWRLDRVPELEEGQKFTDLDTLDFTRYQAILPVPYYNVGSDNYGVPGSGFSVQKSLTLGYQTGLPVTAAMLTRTSQGQIASQMQLVHEPYRPPVVLDDYPNAKPLLLVWFEGMNDDDRARYAHLRAGATKVFERGPLHLYELPLASFGQRIAARKRRLQARRDSLARNSTHRLGAYVFTDTLPTWVHEGFEPGDPAAGYVGSGGFRTEETTNETTLWTGPLPNAAPDRDYLLHLWLYTLRDHYPAAWMYLYEFAPDGTQRQRQAYRAGDHMHVYDPNGWTLQIGRFRPVATDSRFEVRVNNPDLASGDLLADELLLLPAGDSLFWKTPDGWVWNGRFWPDN